VEETTIGAKCEHQTQNLKPFCNTISKLGLYKQRVFYHHRFSHLFVSINLGQWCVMNIFEQNIEQISLSYNSIKD